MPVLTGGRSTPAPPTSICPEPRKGDPDVPLSPDEVQTIDRLHRRLGDSWAADELMFRYFLGQQRVEQLGMAIPPDMRRFLVVTNWCRALVEGYDDRQQVRSLILPGEEKADPQLRAMWDANNLQAHFSMFNIDRMVYGRAFLSVGSNEDDPDLPLIRVESPREMVAEVDVRKESVTAAARFYGTDESGNQPTNVTLYLPDETIWIERRPGGKWGEVDRDPHNLGAVPVVMHLNRRMSGGWAGQSQMADIIPLVDSAVRSLTNMQFAQEAHGIPRMIGTGIAKGDFTDSQGNLIPKWEAYFNAVHLLSSKDAKISQLTAADLKNFETALSMYRHEAIIATKMPARTFAITTTNPASEGALRAEESEFVRRVEASNEQVGMTLGWAAALAHRFATGDWVTGNRIRVDWHNPSTPTIAQRMDATVKAYQSGILSRKGAWKELGWSDARIEQELEFFTEEANDPTLAALMRPLAAVGGGDATDGDD